MSELDSWMLSFNDQCDTTMGIATMACAGQTFSVVDNLTSKSVDGEFGGLEPQVRGVVTAQPADVTSPLTLLNKRCTINGAAYRVSQVDVGTIGIHFTLADPNEK
jgi:hypothetical protein